MNDFKTGRYSPFPWQAAGHDPLTLLNASILCKPIALHPNQLKDNIEAQWYLDLDKEPARHALKPWTPTFHGFMQIPLELELLIAQGLAVTVVDSTCPRCQCAPQLLNLLVEADCRHFSDMNLGKVYLLMENAMSLHREPNLIDIKLGHRLYDDFCTEEKRKRATALAEKTTSAKLGVRLCGMQRWSAQRWRWTRDFGRAMSAESLPSSIRSFFCSIPSNWQPSESSAGWLDSIAGITTTVEQGLVDEVVKQLRAILHAVEQLEDVRIYSSSVLICYEALPSLPTRPTVCMIDFAHAYFRPGLGRDDNYISGLNSLISMLDSI